MVLKIIKILFNLKLIKICMFWCVCVYVTLIKFLSPFLQLVCVFVYVCGFLCVYVCVCVCVCRVYDCVTVGIFLATRATNMSGAGKFANYIVASQISMCDNFCILL